MTTFTALTTLPGREPAQTLADAMEHLDPEPTGVGIFEMEDGSGLWEIGGYFTSAPDVAALSLLAVAFGAADFAVSELPETDWVAHVRRELKPVVAGRFFVYGSHDADKVPGGSVPLLIEAAMAFGTGHHGTTLGCLNMLEQLVATGAPPSGVLDVGCGTAVLAMAAAHVCDGPIIASDIDLIAVDVAKVNIDANDLTGRVHCILADGLDHPDIRDAGPFGLVFANILKAPLIALAPSIHLATAPGGKVILSGILNQQADDVVNTYTKTGYNLFAKESIVDWTTLVLEKTR